MTSAAVVSFRCLNMVFPSTTPEKVHEYVACAVSSIEEEISRRVISYVPNCKWDINTIPIGGGMGRAAYVWLTSEPVVSMFLGLSHEGEVIISGTGTLKNSTEGLSAKEQLFMVDWDEIPTSQWTVFELPNAPGSDKPPKITRARASIPSEGYERGKLFCKTPLPSDYTNERIASLFSHFSTDRKGVHVTRTPNGNAYIEFPNHTDACFALMMRKKYYDSEKGIELSFDHALAKEPSRRPKRR